MNIQDINDLANEVAVQRLMINQYEEELENLTEYQKLQRLIQQCKDAKDEAQSKLIEAMKSEGLKSWKTDQANFARAIRYTASVDPSYKKDIERKLKDGESIDGWELKESEYLSIRTT